MLFRSIRWANNQLEKPSIASSKDLQSEFVQEICRRTKELNNLINAMIVHQSVEDGLHKEKIEQLPLHTFLHSIIEETLDPEDRKSVV